MKIVLIDDSPGNESPEYRIDTSRFFWNVRYSLLNDSVYVLCFTMSMNASNTESSSMVFLRTIRYIADTSRRL